MKAIEHALRSRAPTARIRAVGVFAMILILAKKSPSAKPRGMGA